MDSDMMLLLLMRVPWGLVDIYKNAPFSYTSISVLRSVGMEVFPNLFS